MEKYPLKSLLDVRKLDESEQIRLLANKEEEIKQSCVYLEQLTREKEDFDILLKNEDTRFFQGLQKGIFQIEKIHAFEAYRDKLSESGIILDKKLKDTQKKLCLLRTQRENLRKDAETALTKRKVVETHFDHWQSDQRKEEARQESKALDELCSDRFSRKKNSDTSI